MAARREISAPAKGTELQKNIAAVKKDINTLQSDVRSLAGEAGEVASARMDKALTRSLETLHALAEQADEWREEQTVSLREKIQKEPLKTCAYAFAGGVLLGVFLRR